MIYIEGFMLLVVIYTSLKATSMDCTTGLIPNKLMLRSLVLLMILNGVYYGRFCRNCFRLFLTNLIGLFLMAFFFYVYDLWAAGDSKLFFVTVFGIPARLYLPINLGPAPTFAILIIVFSLAYIYVIGDSLIKGFQDKSLFKIQMKMPQWKMLFSSYLFMVASMRIMNMLLFMLVGWYLKNNEFLLTAIDFFLVLSLFRVRDCISGKLFYMVIITEWGLILVLEIMNIIPIAHLYFDWKSWFIVLIVMALRAIAEQYNYQEIPTETVKERMILAASTVLKFQTSRVHGLPTCITEDLRARLTRQEVDAVLRWKNSKQGQPTVIIIRKIPFAIFITAGIILFLGLEIAAIWRIL